MTTEMARSVKPVTMVTDQQRRRNGSLEPDLLAGVERLPLVFKSFDGDEITRVLPSEPWDHERLQQAANGVAQIFVQAMDMGADAYLGTRWVGSTEV
jgi:5'-deoxynucleotidase